MRIGFRFIVLVTALSMFSAAAARALEPGRPIGEYGHRVWLTQSGLLQDHILCMLESRSGYLWLGTSDGLVRYDGYQFATFDQDNTPSLGLDAARALYEDHSGGLWIGGNSGRFTFLKDGRFNPAFWETMMQGLEPLNIMAIHEDHEGWIWIATDYGLYRHRGGQTLEVTAKDGLTSDQVLALEEDPQGRMWIGTGGSGLFYWQNGRLNAIPRSYTGDTINAIHADGANLWVGGVPGVRLLREGKPQPFPGQNLTATEAVTAIYSDREGYLWYGTLQAGVRRLSPQGVLTSYRHADGLSSDNVTSLLEDREGNMWIGTSVGLNQLRNTSFQNLGEKEGLAGFARSITEDRDGNMWITMEADGLRRYRNGIAERYGNIPYPYLRSVFADSDGSIWVGGDRGNLYHILKNGRTVSYTERDGFTGGSVKSIMRARDGSLWLGTSRGASRLFQDRFSNFSVRDGLPGRELSQILQARDGTMWFVTSGGLAHLSDGKFTNYTMNEGLSSKFLRCLYEDDDGVMWIGTRDGGLNRLKDGKIVVYNRSNGLARNVVFSIVEDADHNLWMSSTRGIFRVRKRELNDYAEGRVPFITSVTYGLADGMVAEECSGNVYPAVWKARDGRFWYPTVGGVSIIDPRHILSDVAPTPALMEKIVVNRKLRPATDAEQQIAPGAGELEFHYTAIAFGFADKLRFKYKLEGFDRDWIDAGPRRAAYYTNIPPGRYVFRVTVQHGDERADEQFAAVVRLRLLPHYYQSAWFWALMALLMLLAALCLYRFWFRRMWQQGRLRTVLVDSRTSETRTRIEHQ
jgi:ligand-binding sensor domain-containing protein